MQTYSNANDTKTRYAQIFTKNKDVAAFLNSMIGDYDLKCDNAISGIYYISEDGRRQ